MAALYRAGNLFRIQHSVGLQFLSDSQDVPDDVPTVQQSFRLPLVDMQAKLAQSIDDYPGERQQGPRHILRINGFIEFGVPTRICGDLMAYTGVHQPDFLRGAYASSSRCQAARPQYIHHHLRRFDHPAGRLVYSRLVRAST